MVGRWFFLAVVGIGLVAIVKAPHGGPPVATITQTCAAPDAVSVKLAWNAPPAGTTEVWVDLSVVDGFPPALTNSHGPLDASVRSYTADGLPAKVRVHYRVNARGASGWKAVAQGTFTTACPAAAGAAAARGDGINVGDVIAVATAAAKVGMGR